jgi:hypothetical protein
MRSVIKQIIKTLAVILVLVITAYLAVYAYLILQFTFVWQCKVYTGELSPEGQKICQQYREGGLVKVLTN